MNNRSLAAEESLTLGERVALMEPQQDSRHMIKQGVGGSREISFKPRSSAKYREDDVDEDRPAKRRGVQSLKLPGGPQGRGRGSFRGGRGGFRGRGRGRGRGRR